MAQILSGLPQDRYMMMCGRVQALLDVLTLPETLDRKASELDEHNRTADTSHQSNGHRDLTFFGSPYWSPSRKPRIYGPGHDPDRNGPNLG